MPEYEPTVWVNETPQTTPIKYKITDDSAGVVAASAKIELVTPITPGTPVDATRLNKIEQGIKAASDAVDALAAAIDAGPPCARVFHSVAQTIPNNTEVVLAFNSERYDTSNLHSTVSNTSRLTAPVAGKYLITAAVSWDSHATGYRTVYLRLNGSTWIAIQRDAVSGTAVWPQTITTVYDLGENDYVEVSVRHTAGVALDILAANNYSPEFAMQWLGP